MCTLVPIAFQNLGFFAIPIVLIGLLLQFLFERRKPAGIDPAKKGTFIVHGFRLGPKNLHTKKDTPEGDALEKKIRAFANYGVSRLAVPTPDDIKMMGFHPEDMEEE